MTGQELYRFGEMALNVPERRLLRRSESVPLAPKAHDILVHLVRNAGRLVTKRELLDHVWAGSFVEEGILSVHISGLRKALGDAIAESLAAHLDAHPKRPAGVFGNWADLRRGITRAPSRFEVYELVGRGRLSLLSFSRSEVTNAISTRWAGCRTASR